MKLDENGNERRKFRRKYQNNTMKSVKSYQRPQMKFTLYFFLKILKSLYFLGDFILVEASF